MIKLLRGLSRCAIPLLLALLMSVSCFAASELSLEERERSIYGPSTLGDVAIARLAVYGILDDTLRAPTKESGNPISRIEAVKLLFSAFANGGEAEIELPFTDVGPEDKPAVFWAYGNRISAGVSRTKFGTGDVTEQEFVTMLLHAIGYTDSFSFSEALAFAHSLGLAPLGLPQEFSLRSAALYLQDALCMTGPDGTPVRERANIRTGAEQQTFPEWISLTPVSVEDADRQIQYAVRYLPPLIDVDLSYLERGEALSLISDYLNDALDLKAQSSGGEKWYAPCVKNKTFLNPSLQIRSTTATSGLNLSLRVQYNNAWKLACDVDDAFTLYTDDALCLQADAFYQRYVAGAESERDAVQRARDAIVERAKYAKDFEVVKEQKVFPQEAHSMLGFFQRGEIVCDGYAELFQYLMLRANIPCVMVLGNTKSQALAEQAVSNHAWNKVKLDGQWFNIDVCWADTARTDQYDLRDDAYYAQHEHWAVTYRGL